MAQEDFLLRFLVDLSAAEQSLAGFAGNAESTIAKVAASAEAAAASLGAPGQVSASEAGVASGTYRGAAAGLADQLGFSATEKAELMSVVSQQFAHLIPEDALGMKEFSQGVKAGFAATETKFNELAEALDGNVVEMVSFREAIGAAEDGVLEALKQQAAAVIEDVVAQKTGTAAKTTATEEEIAAQRIAAKQKNNAATGIILNDPAGIAAIEEGGALRAQKASIEQAAYNQQMALIKSETNAQEGSLQAILAEKEAFQQAAQAAADQTAQIEAIYTQRNAALEKEVAAIEENVAREVQQDRERLDAAEVTTQKQIDANAQAIEARRTAEAQQIERQIALTEKEAVARESQIDAAYRQRAQAAEAEKAAQDKTAEAEIRQQLASEEAASQAQIAANAQAARAVRLAAEAEYSASPIGRAETATSQAALNAEYQLELLASDEYIASTAAGIVAKNALNVVIDEQVAVISEETGLSQQQLESKAASILAEQEYRLALAAQVRLMAEQAGVAVPKAYQQGNESGGGAGFGDRTLNRVNPVAFLPTLIGFAAIGQFRSAFDEAQKLQKVLEQIQAQFNALGEGDKFPGFRDSILAIAADSGIASDQVAQLAQQFNAAFNGDITRTLQETDSAVKAIAVDGLDVQTAIDSFTALDKAFESTDVTAAQLNDTALGLQERFGVLAKDTVTFAAQIAPIAAQTGFTAQQIEALGAAYQQVSGRSGSAGAEQLGRVFGNIQTKGLALVEFFQRINPEIAESLAGSLGSGNIEQVFETLLHNYGSLSAQQKEVLTSTIAGKREAGTLAAIFDQSGKVLDELNGRYNDSGKTLTYYQNLQETLAQKIKEVKEQFTQLVIALAEGGIGNALGDVLTTATLVFGAFGKILDVVGALNEATHGWAGRFVEITALVTVLNKTLLGGALGNIPGLGGVFGAGGPLGKKGTSGGETDAAVAGRTLEEGATSAATIFKSGVEEAAAAIREAMGTAAATTEEASVTAGEELVAGAAAAAAELEAGGAGAAAIDTGEKVAGGLAITAGSVVSSVAIVAVSLAGLVKAIGDAKSAVDAGKGDIAGNVSSALGKGQSRDDILNNVKAQGGDSATGNVVGDIVLNGLGITDSPTAEYDKEIRRQTAELDAKKLEALKAIKGNASNLSAEQAIQAGVQYNNTLQGLIDALRQDPTNNALRAIIDQIIKKAEGDAAVNAAFTKVASDYLAGKTPAANSTGNTSINDAETALRNAFADQQKQQADKAAAFVDGDAAKGLFESGDIPFAQYEASLQNSIKILNEQTNGGTTGDQATIDKLNTFKKDFATAESNNVLSKIETLNQFATDAQGSASSQGNVDRLLGGLRSGKLNNSDSAKATNQIIQNLKEIQSARVAAAKTVEEQAAILEEGISVPQEVQDEETFQFIKAYETDFENFVIQAAAGNENLADDVLRSTIEIHNATGESFSQAAKDALETQAKVLELQAAAEIIMVKNLIVIGKLFHNQPGTGFFKIAKAILDQATKDVKDAQSLTDAANGDAAPDVTDVPNFSTIGSDPSAAAEKRKQAAEDQKKKAQDLAQAQLDYALALIENDPVKAAYNAQQQALLAYSQAEDEASRIKAQAQGVRANRQLANAIQDIIKSQFELAIAYADAAGDTVEAAKLGVQEAQQNLDNLIATGAGDSAINQAKGELAGKQANLRDAQLNDQKQTYEFLHDIGKITTGQLIEYLQSLLAIPNLTKAEVQDIQKEIYSLRQQLGQDFKFNLPSNLGLPTLYEVRRFDQSGGGGGNYDQRVITVNVTTASTDPQAVANAVIAVVGDPSRTSVAPRRY